MIKFADDDFPAVRKALAERQAYQADERSSVHAKRNLIRIGGIQKGSHSLPGAGNDCVHFLALAIRATSLHIPTEQMVIHRVEYRLGDLRAGSIVEKHRAAAAIQCGKHSPHALDRKLSHPCPFLSHDLCLTLPPAPPRALASSGLKPLQSLKRH